MCSVGLKAGRMFRLFEIGVFKNFGQFCVCKHSGLWEAVNACLYLHADPTVVTESL